MRKNRPLIELPRLIDVSFNAIDNINDVISRLKLRGNFLVIGDQNTKKIAGDRVHNIICENNNSEFYQIEGATVENGNLLQEVYTQKKIDAVIAVGGGGVIDLAKYSSFNYGIPFLSVPTIASHDGIASARASLLGQDRKHSFNAHSPIGVIGDINTISKAPRRYTLSGVGDIISNLSAILDWELSNRITGEHISRYAVALASISAQSMIDNKDILAKEPVEGAYLVTKTLITSSMAMCIAGSSRPASGAEHMISHMIDEVLDTKALHGEQCGIASIVTMYLHGGDWKLIKDTLSYIGAPHTLAEINISKEEFLNVLMNAHMVRKNRFTILSSGLSKSASLKAINSTKLVN